MSFLFRPCFYFLPLSSALIKSRLLFEFNSVLLYLHFGSIRYRLLTFGLSTNTTPPHPIPVHPPTNLSHDLRNPYHSGHSHMDYTQTKSNALLSSNLQPILYYAFSSYLFIILLFDIYSCCNTIYSFSPCTDGVEHPQFYCACAITIKIYFVLFCSICLNITMFEIPLRESLPCHGGVVCVSQGSQRLCCQGPLPPGRLTHG